MSPPTWLDAHGRPRRTVACWTCGREVAPMRFRTVGSSAPRLAARVADLPDCLAEYFALHQEMATVFEMPDQAGPLAPPRVIHVLLAQTEQRLVATLERYGEDLTAVAVKSWTGAATDNTVTGDRSHRPL